MHAKKRMQEITKRIFGGADLKFLRVHENLKIKIEPIYLFIKINKRCV